jgi:NTE family protein
MNNQKYDAVFEGGGVKGIALIGALKRLEEKNIGRK